MVDLFIVFTLYCLQEELSLSLLFGLQIVFVAVTKTFLCQASVSFGIEDNGSIGKVLDSMVLVFCTPSLKSFVLVRGTDAKIFEMSKGVGRHADKEA